MFTFNHGAKGGSVNNFFHYSLDGTLNGKAGRRLMKWAIFTSKFFAQFFTYRIFTNEVF